MNMNRGGFAVATPALALAVPAVAFAHDGSHRHQQADQCAFVLSSGNDAGFGDAGVLSIVAVTTADIVLLNGFAHDTDRDSDRDSVTSRARATPKATAPATSVLPILPITTGDIVAGYGCFEGDGCLEGDVEDFFFGGDDGDDS